MSIKPVFTQKFEIYPASKQKPFTDYFPSFTNGVVKAERTGFTLFSDYPILAERLYQMPGRKDDAWIMAFPKSGTTWVTELVWLLKNNLNYKEAKERVIVDRAPWPELLVAMPKEAREIQSSEFPIIKTPEELDKLPSPRVIRSHLLLEFLHPDLLDSAKVIYVARNPKDVIVSYYYYSKAMKTYSYTGTFEEWVELFMKSEVMYTPYFPHLLEAWGKKDHPNMHFMFYEDMKIDIRREIRKLADFLQVKINDEDIEKLTVHLDIKSFEKNEAVNQDFGKKLGVMNEGTKFMRKGIIGDWKNHFTPELNKRVDEWIDKNLEGSGLTFATE